MIEYVDVFSGIGGISYALKEFAKVIQYCEWDKYCQQVLAERMRDGSLDMASIHGDIRTLHISPVMKPVMIAGGFPCQDISSIGNKRGIADGARSGMFYEIMRLVDENPSIRIVFLENVANISNCGMKEVVDELVARDFDFQWIMRSAGVYGAPHQRMRWFCLAVKRSSGEHDNDNPLAQIPHDLLTPSTDAHIFWSSGEPCPRVTFRHNNNIPAQQENPTDANWISRFHTLGNSVVPIVVREAFKELVRFQRHWANVEAIFGDYKTAAMPAAEMRYPFPDQGIVLGGRHFIMPMGLLSVPQPAPRHCIDICVKHSNADGVLVETKMQNYPTPRRGNTHASTVTERSLRDLPTILVYSTKTTEYLEQRGYVIPEGDKRHNHLIANINYVEWMMGYRKDWTKVATSSTLLSAAQSLQRQQSDGEEERPIATTNNTQLLASPITKRRRGRPRLSENDNKSVAKPTYKLNGMHVLMRDNPGKDVKVVAQMWRALTPEQKQEFTNRAHAINEGGFPLLNPR